MSHHLRDAAALILTSIIISGCSTPFTTLEASAADVQVRMDNGFNADKCDWLGEVTGTEGHWYSYLFFNNDALVRGSLNDIKNRAKKLGANTVYMIAPQDFTTSFTVVGNAYKCG